MGRSAGSRNVFSRLNTRVMNAPSGFVSASTTRRKNRIWNHPLFVMVRTFPDAASRTRDKPAEPSKRPAKQLCPPFLTGNHGEAAVRAVRNGCGLYLEPARKRMGYN